MKHLNGNVLCAVDTETTGTDPKKHEIIQVAVVLLDNQLNICKKLLPFSMDLKPLKPETIDTEAIEVSRSTLTSIMLNGADPNMAADLFVDWFNKLGLVNNKKICPLAHNWPFDREFLIQWLGPKTFEMIFHPWYRDTMAMALYDNDAADWKGEEFPYPKCNLGYLCSQLKIDRYNSHNALDDAVATATVYKRMIKERHY